MRSIALVCAALAAFAQVVVGEKCVIQGASIGKFDLNGLRNAKSDYSGISNADGGDISLNFCGPTVEDPIAAGEGTGAYIQDSRGGISLGKYSTVPQYHNGQLSLTYKDGAACPKSNGKRSSLIYLQCDKSWSGSKVTLIDSIDDCFYVFTLKTPHACSQSGGFFSAVWSVIVFLFWISLVVAIAGFVYTRFIANKNASSGFGNGGSSAASGLAEAASFVKDMILIVGIWTLDTAQSLVSRLRSRSRGSSSYSTAAYNPYTPAPHVSTAPSSGGAAGSTHADYSSSAWRATTRTGPPEPPAKDGGRVAQPSQHAQQEETMPGLAGGGSLLDDDDDDDEGAELTMGGTGSLKV